MLAAANHRVNCVQILLQQGAEPQLKAKVRLSMFYNLLLKSSAISE